MNARILPGWLSGMVLAGGVAVLSFAQETASDTSAAPAPLPPAQTASGSVGDKPLPSSMQLSAGSMDVQRLTQAGVGEDVILAFITNSTRIFNLTPSQIIYLKEIGTPTRVLSAMISHDQTLPPALPAETVVVSSPETVGPTIIANDDAWPPLSIIADDEGYAPEQPESMGPVRAPYPVKLSDPIVILKLPSFTIPYW
jgi:hypothetical protein